MITSVKQNVSGEEVGNVLHTLVQHIEKGIMKRELRFHLIINQNGTFDIDYFVD